MIQSFARNAKTEVAIQQVLTELSIWRTPISSCTPVKNAGRIIVVAEEDGIIEQERIVNEFVMFYTRCEKDYHYQL